MWRTGSAEIKGERRTPSCIYDAGKNAFVPSAVSADT